MVCRMRCVVCKTNVPTSHFHAVVVVVLTMAFEPYHHGFTYAGDCLLCRTAARLVCAEFGGNKMQLTQSWRHHVMAVQPVATSYLFAVARAHNSEVTPTSMCTCNSTYAIKVSFLVPVQNCGRRKAAMRFLENLVVYGYR